MTLSGKRLFSSCATRLFVVAAGNLNSGAGKSSGSRSDAGSLLDGELFHFVQIRRGVITAVQEREGEGEVIQSRHPYEDIVHDRGGGTVGHRRMRGRVHRGRFEIGSRSRS